MLDSPLWYWRLDKELVNYNGGDGSCNFKEWYIRISTSTIISVNQGTPVSLWLIWLDSVFRWTAFISFHSRTVLLSRCQSQQANSPRALSGWNSLEKAGHVLVPAQPVFIQKPMWDIPWGGERLISRTKTMSSGPAGSERRRRRGSRRKRRADDSQCPRKDSAVCRLWNEDMHQVMHKDMRDATHFCVCSRFSAYKVTTYQICYEHGSSWISKSSSTLVSDPLVWICHNSIFSSKVKPSHCASRNKFAYKI